MVELQQPGAFAQPAPENKVQYVDGIRGGGVDAGCGSQKVRNSNDDLQVNFGAVCAGSPVQSMV
jgi:hypothetical protein